MSFTERTHCVLSRFQTSAHLPIIKIIKICEEFLAGKRVKNAIWKSSFRKKPVRSTCGPVMSESLSHDKLRWTTWKFTLERTHHRQNFDYFEFGRRSSWWKYVKHHEVRSMSVLRWVKHCLCLRSVGPDASFPAYAKALTNILCAFPHHRHLHLGSVNESGASSKRFSSTLVQPARAEWCECTCSLSTMKIFRFQNISMFDELGTHSSRQAEFHTKLHPEFQAESQASDRLWTSLSLRLWDTLLHVAFPLSSLDSVVRCTLIHCDQSTSIGKFHCIL